LCRAWLFFICYVFKSIFHFVTQNNLIGKKLKLRFLIGVINKLKNNQFKNKTCRKVVSKNIWHCMNIIKLRPWDEGISGRGSEQTKYLQATFDVDFSPSLLSRSWPHDARHVFIGTALTWQRLNSGFMRNKEKQENKQTGSKDMTTTKKKTQIKPKSFS
jgi:hypothetical protein